MNHEDAASTPRIVEFTHRGTSIRLELPPSADALIDDAAFAADERLPYWADLWPSAVALARHVLDAPTIEPRAIELGCGVGLVSLALAARGVDVLATDYEVDALACLRAGAVRSGIQPPALAVVDWRSPPRIEPAPLVVAADVLYEQRNALPLAECLQRMVAPGGRAIVADPGRRWLGYFLKRMRDAGWTTTTVAERDEEGTAPGARASRVRVVELVRIDPGRD